MKAMRITLRRPGVAPLQFSGIFPTEFDAIARGIDIAAQASETQPCAITVEVLS